MVLKMMDELNDEMIIDEYFVVVVEDELNIHVLGLVFDYLNLKLMLVYLLVLFLIELLVLCLNC
jgi:hypothetical protein